MSKYEQLTNEVIDGFQKLRGNAAVTLYKPINTGLIVYEVIKRFHNKHPNDRVLVVVENYQTRMDVRDAFKYHNDTDEYIKIFGKDYIKDEYIHGFTLAIGIGINNNVGLIQLLKQRCKFNLIIITENLCDNEFNTTIFKEFKFIQTSVNLNDLIYDNVYCPVEEHIINTSFTERDQILYDKCTQFINDTVAIFGDLDTIEQARTGNAALGLSAASIRDRIAKDAGWSPVLNTNEEYNKIIDTVYNPNNLLERVNTFYNIVKQRKDLVSDNLCKLEQLYKIINDNPNKRIIIVSKRGDFAATITKYLTSKNVNCVDYHDCIEDSYDYDEYGSVIVYKTGANKGKPKILKSQARSTKNLKLYNSHRVNILNIKNASDNTIKTDCDLLIFTSSFCEEIYTFKKRFTGLKINSKPNMIYTIIINNTIEKTQLNKRETNLQHTIIENNLTNVVFDEKLNNIIVDI